MHIAPTSKKQIQSGRQLYPKTHPNGPRETQTGPKSTPRRPLLNPTTTTNQSQIGPRSIPSCTPKSTLIDPNQPHSNPDQQNIWSKHANLADPALMRWKSAPHPLTSAHVGRNPASSGPRRVVTPATWAGIRTTLGRSLRRVGPICATVGLRPENQRRLRAAMISAQRGV